jgi:RHS repeat-associated protein
MVRMIRWLIFLLLVCVASVAGSFAQLPTGWTDADIGSVGTAGSASYSSGTFSVTGSGYVINQSSDGFHFVYQQVSGDVTIVARMDGMSGYNTGAGVMIRETLDPGSKFAFSDALPYSTSGYFNQATRTTTNSGSSFQVFGVQPLPYWVKLVRTGNSFNSSFSSDGINWSSPITQTISMASSVYVGLAVGSGTSTAVTIPFTYVSLSTSGTPAPSITTSATTGDIGTQVLLSGTGFGASQGNSVVTLNGSPVTVNSWNNTGILVTIPSGATSGPLELALAPSMNYSNPIIFTVTTQPLPTGWVDGDVGQVGLAGNATYASGAFTITGAGYGSVNQTSDYFHWAYQPLSGDGVIVARVTSLSGSSSGLGVMVRESLDPSARQAITFAWPYSSSLYLNYASRTSPGTYSSWQSAVGVQPFPYWIKLVRSGNSFASYFSSDGVNWGSGFTQTVTMAQNVYIGLVVWSGTTSSTASATFDNVLISGGVMPLVLSVSPTSGAVGTAVTVNGASFGAVQGTSTVTFNGAAATSISSWSNNQIVAAVPNSATNGPVVVAVNSTASNANVNFVVNHPVIDELAPPAAIAGAWVNINGHGFGTNAFNTDTVNFNGVQAAIVSWSDTQVRAVVPSTTTSGPVTVTKGGVTSDGVSFTLESGPPTITNLSPVQGVVGAWPITISGSGFGPTQSNSTVKFWGSSVSAQVISWSETAITVVVPDDAISGPIKVTVATVDANGPWFYIQSVAQLTDSQSNVTTYTSLMVSGQWTAQESNGPGCSTCSIRGNEQNSLDSNGNLSVHTDALSHTTSYSYDSDFNVISVSQPLDGSTTATTSYTYNDKGEVLTMTDPLGHVTTNTYDTHGNLLTVTSPAPNGSTTASVTQFGYDSLGELTSITDPLNHVTSIAYTSAGLVHTITDAQSHITTYGYDARGNRTGVTDALNHTTSFAYNIMGRLTGITYPDSSTVSFTYDSRGRRTSVTDQLNHTTTYTYDDSDRLTAVTDAATHATQYAYDTENNLTSITDANNHATSFTYNPRGWVTQTSFPSSHVETYDYDALGNLTSKIDRKGQTITYVYDALNRMVQKNYPDSTDVEYIYDLVGKVAQVNDPTGTYGFAYDNMGRLIGTTTQYTFLPGQTFTNSYAYDAASNRTGFTAPDGSTNIYSYDTMNQVSNLTNSLTGSFGFSYDSLNRRTQFTRPNGVNTTYTYDNVSQLQSVLHQAGGTTLDGDGYTYDAAGNRVSKTNHLNNVTEDYSYDSLYQLTQVTQGASTTETYTYDAVGNRLSSLGVSLYQYNSSNELTSTPSASFAYDHNGNTASKTDSSGTTTYNWNSNDQLTSVVLPGSGGTVSFKYDPFGRRIQKSGPVGVTNYLYDDDNLPLEIDNSGNVIARYIHDGIDDSLSELRSGVIGFYQQDGLGSTISVTSAAGALADTYTYDSFGNLTASSGTSTNPLRYTTREFDQETGFYFNRARYYDPSSGRFLSEDPLGFAGGDIDFYAYVGNNPVRFVDPFGLQRANSPRLGPPGTDVFFPDPLRPGEGTIRVYGPNGEAVTDYDFGHPHGGTDPHAHDWGVDSNGKPVRGKQRPIKPTECSIANPYWNDFWKAFYVSYSDHMVRVWDSIGQDFDDLRYHLTHPATPNPVPFGPPPPVTPPPPYIWIAP